MQLPMKKLVDRYMFVSSICVYPQSDLHIEENDSEYINTEEYIIPIAPILILAGDIGNLYKKISLNAKKSFFLEKIYKIIALNHDAIEVAIGIIMNPTF